MTDTDVSSCNNITFTWLTICLRIKHKNLNEVPAITAANKPVNKIVKKNSKVFTGIGKISHYCISYQLMVDAVLEIMQKAVVPWSNVVEKLVQQYLEMDGPKYVYFVLSLILFFFFFFYY